jgi:hypothetical protein
MGDSIGEEVDLRHSRTYLVHGGRSGLEPLKLPGSWLRRLVIEQQLLRHISWLGGGLPIDKIDWKALRIENGGNVSAAGSVFHFLDSVADAFCVGKLDNPLDGVNFSLGTEYGLGSLEWFAAFVVGRYYLPFEILIAFNLKRATKELLRALLRIVHILIGTVTSIPSLRLGLLRNLHAKICSGEVRLEVKQMRTAP